jgi:hypothetical protein
MVAHKLLRHYASPRKTINFATEPFVCVIVAVLTYPLIPNPRRLSHDPIEDRRMHAHE